MSIEPAIESKRSLVYVIGLAVLGPIVFLVLPVVLGALAVELGLGESQLGLLATVELLGIAVASTTGLYWATRWHWRTVARATIGIVIAGNLVTWFVLADASFSFLLTLRAGIGLAAGALMAIVYSYLAAHPHTERAAGFLVATQTAMQVGGVYLIPAVIALPLLGGILLGAKGIFAVFAVVAVVLLVTAGALPAGPGEATVDGLVENDPGANRAPAIIVLVSFLLFFVGQTAVWGFLELFGADAGLSYGDTILAITLSTAAAVLGPLFAGAFGDRFGQLKPLIAAGLLQFAGLTILLLVKVDFFVMLVSLSLFQVGWTMALPFHLGVLTDVDPTHKYIVLTPPASAVGIALGPICGGVFIESFGYGALFVVVGVVLVLYLACILPFADRRAA